MIDKCDTYLYKKQKESIDLKMKDFIKTILPDVDFTDYIYTEKEIPFYEKEITANILGVELNGTSTISPKANGYTPTRALQTRQRQWYSCINGQTVAAMLLSFLHHRYSYKRGSCPYTKARRAW